MTLPTPHEQLCGCLWLPRILAKARLLEAGKLPADYARRFCHPTGVDGFFISFFELTREAILAASQLPEAAAVEWFLSMPMVSQESIEAWNMMAVNLGTPGFPMAERLTLAKAMMFSYFRNSGVETIFELIELEESYRAD